MNEERSIRDELAQIIADNSWGYSGVEQDVDDRNFADLILASPVIRRIQAEAIRELSSRAGSNLGTPGNGHTSVYSVRMWLREEANRIEKGSSDV